MQVAEEKAGGRSKLRVSTQAKRNEKERLKNPKTNNKKEEEDGPTDSIPPLSGHGKTRTEQAERERKLLLLLFLREADGKREREREKQLAV